MALCLLKSQLGLVCQAVGGGPEWLSLAQFLLGFGPTLDLVLVLVCRGWLRGDGGSACGRRGEAPRSPRLPALPLPHNSHHLSSSQTPDPPFQHPSWRPSPNAVTQAQRAAKKRQTQRRRAPRRAEKAAATQVSMRY